MISANAGTSGSSAIIKRSMTARLSRALLAPSFSASVIGIPAFFAAATARLLYSPNGQTSTRGRLPVFWKMKLLLRRMPAFNRSAYSASVSYRFASGMYRRVVTAAASPPCGFESILRCMSKVCEAISTSPEACISRTCVHLSTGLNPGTSGLSTLSIHVPINASTAGICLAFNTGNTRV